MNCFIPKKILFFVAMAFLATANSADPKLNPTQKAMINDLEAANYHLSYKYAPKEWKTEYLGWSLEKEFLKAKQRIIDNPILTNRDYRLIFKDFLNSSMDYHVNFVFYSTSWAVAPIEVKGINGHYYITKLFGKNDSLGGEAIFFEGIDEKLLVKGIVQLHVGDEILSIDNIPIKIAIENLIECELGGDKTPTAYAMAEKMLFARLGKYGCVVPSGTFKLKIQPKEDVNGTFSVILPWFYAKEWVKDIPIQDSTMSLWGNESDAIRNSISKDFSVGIAKDLLLARHALKLDSDDDNANEISDSRMKGFLPPLGTIIWENAPDEKIYSYLYEMPDGKKIGYLRLASFHFNFEEDYDKAFEAITKSLKYFNEHSEALVFDISDNPGGSVMFLYGVLSTLVGNEPFKLPLHKEILIPEDAFYAAITVKEFDRITEELEKNEELEDTIQGFPISKDFFYGIQAENQMKLDCWNAGNTLTDLSPLMGIEIIPPNPIVTYTKPLIVLVNEYDFSCADFFPAILQDNKRALIFGKQTSGAGGYVKQYSYASRFGVKAFTMTGSIAYRLDGKPIENLGVTPDVPYDLTKRDVQEGYVDYIKAVHDTVDQVLTK